MGYAIAVSMAVATTAAQAGFLYVPQDETAPGAVGEADSEGAGEAHVRQPERSADAELWRVHSGEMLRDVLARWGGHAGVEVLFLTDRRYRLHEGRTFAGSFGDATKALFSSLSHLPHPPVGVAKANGGALVVMHRASLHRASPHRPGRAGDGQ